MVCQQESKTYFSVAGYKINETDFLMLIWNKALNYLSSFEYLIPWSWKQYSPVKHHNTIEFQIPQKETRKLCKNTFLVKMLNIDLIIN